MYSQLKDAFVTMDHEDKAYVAITCYSPSASYIHANEDGGLATVEKCTPKPDVISCGQAEVRTT